MAKGHWNVSVHQVTSLEGTFRFSEDKVDKIIAAGYHAIVDYYCLCSFLYFCFSLFLRFALCFIFLLDFVCLFVCNSKVMFNPGQTQLELKARFIC